MDLIRYADRLGLEAAEALYERVAGYGFAKRYVDGKIVADIGREGLGYGSRLLAGSARSVTGMSDSGDHVELAAASYPAPNVAYEHVDLSELPYPEDYFDVVVALGIIEDLKQSQSILEQVRRILKQDGVLILSIRDRQTGADERGGVYVPQFRESLEGHFESVLVYRQGAVAGGLVSPISTEVSDASVQSASLALSDPRVGTELPAMRSVLAVCGGSETLKEERPYLLLDRDRRIFDECEDRTEDVELLRDEIRRMQETEVQAFQDSLKLHRTEIAYLRAQVRTEIAYLRAQVRSSRAERNAKTAELNAEIRRLRDQVHAMESSTTWRLFEPYRRLRSSVDRLRRRTTGGAS